jgi:hypothetical protein
VFQLGTDRDSESLRNYGDLILEESTEELYTAASRCQEYGESGLEIVVGSSISESPYEIVVFGWMKSMLKIQVRILDDSGDADVIPLSSIEVELESGGRFAVQPPLPSSQYILSIIPTLRYTG